MATDWLTAAEQTYIHRQPGDLVEGVSVSRYPSASPGRAEHIEALINVPEHSLCALEHLAHRNIN